VSNLFNPLRFGPGKTEGAFYIKGIPVYETPYLEPNHTAIELPKPSRNRSRRLLKKLMQRMRESARPMWTEVLLITDPITRLQYFVCPYTIYDELRRAMT
jgi:hypothetical protein